MELKGIKANGHRVIANGSVIGFSEMPEYEFDLHDANGFRFTLKLIFEEKGGKEPSINSDVTDGNITIHCKDFTNSLGTGFTIPVVLATVGCKKIFFKFEAYNMKELPVLEYTFYED